MLNWRYGHYENFLSSYVIFGSPKGQICKVLSGSISHNYKIVGQLPTIFYVFHYHPQHFLSSCKIVYFCFFAIDIRVIWTKLDIIEI